MIAIMFTTGLYAQQRATTVLSDNWHIKQLDNDKPDIAALTRQAVSPDKTWLPAKMPAQVHDVMLVLRSIRVENPQPLGR